MKLNRYLVACVLGWVGAGAGALAQQTPLPDTNAPSAAARTAAGEMDIRADQLEYRGNGRILVGTGHVEVRWGPDTMKADFTEFNTVTYDLHARGNVVFERGGKTWKGQEVRYNFKKQQGDFGAFEGYVEPFHIYAEDSKRVSEKEIVLDQATITTCDGPHPAFYIEAGRTRITNGDTIRARNAVFYLGGVPFFYTPYLKKYIGPSRFDIDVVPGFGSRMGAFLLTSFNFHLAPQLRSSTHLDYRSKRGVAVGQDFWWGTNIYWQGKVKSYYLSDQKPYKDDDEEKERKGLVEKERYRLRLLHNQSLTDRDSLWADVNYLSDPYVLEDFFYEEYRYNQQPENRLTLTHRGDDFSAGLQVNKRLNDFYGNVDRVPEAFLNFNRQPIGDTPFYYEGQNLASRLERLYPEDEDTDSYDAYRLNTEHTIYYPTRHFGFLNVTPRAGYRGTFYSETYETKTETNVVVTVDTNGVANLSTNVASVTRELGSGFRNVYELGFETSFKAFKVFSDEPTGLGHDEGLRHVLEPYANYTYVPEPNLRPAEVPQFDSIDAYDKRNDVRFGMRNKLQTKRKKIVTDLFNLNTYTTYRFERDPGVNEFTDLFFDLRVNLLESLPMEFKGGYDMYESKLSQFDGKVSYAAEDKSELSAEYYYRDPSVSQVATRLNLFPEDRWSFESYVRYNIEKGSWDEHSYLLRHKFECLGLGLGVRNRSDETEVWLQIWLLAFPGSRLDTSHGYDHL